MFLINIDSVLLSEII